MKINQEKMKSAFESLSKDLGNGFLASEVWAIGEGRPLIRDHGYNDNPKVAPLFNEVTRKLYRTLQESAYPGLGNYYMVNLDNNHLVVVITIGKLQQFVLVDLAKTSMGILMSVALPNLINFLTEEFAVEDSLETESSAKAESPAKPEAAAEAKSPARPEATASSTEEKKTEKKRQRSTLREIFSAFSEGGYYSDKIKE